MYSISRRHTILVTVFVALLAFASRVNAVEISNVKISGVKEDSATITWTTDVSTDAAINYGLDPSVGMVRDATFDKKDHILTIDNLDPQTTYYFRAVSTDQDGNHTATGGFVLTTKGADALKKKIIKEIKKVTDPQDIKDIVEAAQQQADDVVHPPTVLGAAKVAPEINVATVTWTTDRPSGSMVYAAPESEYKEGSKNPYSMTQGDPKESVTKHTVVLVGLEPLTTYHFQATSPDDLGLSGETVDDTFTTKSTLPTIANLKATRVQETSATITWSTGDVPAKGLVNYTNMRTKATRSVGSPVFASSQNILLAGLEFGTRYSVTVAATNQAGDVVESKPLSFVTVRDVIPPAISKVNNESTLYPTEDTKVQTIISWLTDEPATCQVFYTQGLVHGDGNEGDSLPGEQNPVSIHTQVIVGLAPGTVFKFWLRCQDVARNVSQSDDYVLITPIKEKNIIDVILENFQGTFGWVKNIGK